MKILFALSISLTLCSIPLLAQDSPDPNLLVEINRIKAVDNHTHVPQVVSAGEKDDEFDALPCDPLDPSDVPTMARADNPLFLKAWQKLYGYKYNDRDAAHVRELLETKQRIAREQGDNYPAWVLDRLNIEYMLANRVAMGRGLNPPRFLWVPFDDALMTPLAADSVADTPDKKVFYGQETKLLKAYMSQAGVSALPDTLDEYVGKVITPTLEAQKKAGAPAIKYEAAYLRPLSFGHAPGAEERAETQRIYGRYAKGDLASRAEVLQVQNFLFRTIAREAGRLGMAVHIHTGQGCGI